MGTTSVARAQSKRLLDGKMDLPFQFTGMEGAAQYLDNLEKDIGKRREG
jgi:hypothetical protein